MMSRALYPILSLWLAANMWPSPSAARQASNQIGPVMGRLLIAPVGEIWTSENGFPYSASMQFELDFILGKEDFRQYRNDLLGPFIGLRFAHLDVGEDWEGEFGLRYTRRLLFRNSLVPVDVTFGLDAGVGTRGRVPTGVALGITKLHQSALLRFAVDWVHVDPLVELQIALRLFGGTSSKRVCVRDEKPGWDLFQLGVFRQAYARYPSTMVLDYPETIDNYIDTLAELADWLRQHNATDPVNEELLKRMVLFVDADALPDKDNRNTVEIIFHGVREKIRIERCTNA